MPLFARFSSHIVSWTAGNVDANAKTMFLALLEAEILPFLYFGWLPWKQLKGKQ